MAVHWFADRYSCRTQGILKASSECKQCSHDLLQKDSSHQGPVRYATNTIRWLNHVSMQEMLDSDTLKPATSVQNNELQTDYLSPTSCQFLAWHAPWPWRWRQYVCLKCLWTSTKLYTITFANTELNIIADIFAEMLLDAVGINGSDKYQVFNTETC
jgi:hypothetical protein